MLAPDSTPVDITVVDCNGIHTVKVVFCECPGVGNWFQQLLEARLFPATVDIPQTVFTFDVLRDFHLHTLSSKKTPYDFLYALRMKTDNAFPEEVKNPMQEFNRVIRLWRTLLIVKRSGGWHDLGRSFPLRKQGATAFPCFACPEPGFNVAEGWAEDDDVDEEFLHLATAFWSLDGHYGLQRKQKIDDPDDVSLLEGSAMFPKDKWSNDIMAKHGKHSPQKSTCAKFKAMELQNRLKFKGTVISGVVAVQCARHGVFMSATDLSLGELFINGDLAIAIAMEFVMAESLRRTKFFRRLVIIYDIACQFHVKFRDRFEKYLPELSDTVDFIRWLIGKMHIDNHLDDCKYRFSLNYTMCCGRTDGEGIERTWSEIKQAGGSTKEMNHGNRHDALIDFWNHWNWIRLVRMVKLLKSKIIDGRNKVVEKVDYYMRLTLNAGEEQVSRWEGMSTEPRYNPVTKEVTSVYRFDQSLLPSQESVLNSLLERENKREELENEDCVGTEAVAFINQGLKLESLQLEIKRLVKAAGITPEQLAVKRDRLRLRIKSWRELQLEHMPRLRELLASIKVGFPEDEDLILPSSPSDRQYAHSALGEVEADLRKGQAYDAVAEVKYTLMHKTVLVATKRKVAKGQRLNTRAKKFIRHVAKNQDVMSAKYRTARERLINLGVTSGDPTSGFPPLNEDTDLYRPGTEKYDAQLGEGSKTVGWIWSNEAFCRESLRTEGQQDKIAEELERVPWFRVKADAQRWIEEVEILEEEFRRTIAGCNKMGEVWEQAADPQGRGPGYVAYAHQKADMFRLMANKARNVFESKEVGGGWPSEGQSLTVYLRGRRPKMTVDWKAVRGRSLEAALKDTPGVIQSEDESSSDSEAGSSAEQIGFAKNMYLPRKAFEPSHLNAEFDARLNGAFKCVHVPRRQQEWFWHQICLSGRREKHEFVRRLEEEATANDAPLPVCDADGDRIPVDAVGEEDMIEDEDEDEDKDEDDVGEDGGGDDDGHGSNWHIFAVCRLGILYVHKTCPRNYVKDLLLRVNPTYTDKQVIDFFYKRYYIIRYGVFTGYSS
ncbi:hypothetical protein PQX77_009695 [Marasmius sp. AFHP31]|nr:hypothetical protein PQX77_009695 [Marasmius sp. AFHP31]